MSVRRPCTECPWRKDVAPGQFAPENYLRLAQTGYGKVGAEAPLDATWFACHKSNQDEEFHCAGWLAAVGYEHLGVRLAVVHGVVDAAALDPGEDWPELHLTWDDLLATHTKERLHEPAS